MNSLFKDIRSEQNVFSAWRHVKRSALTSANPEIKGNASEFEHAHQRHIRRIISQLRDGSFEFAPVEGILKDKKKRLAKGKDPRPIAIATIENRVVQRAILQVLQPRKARDLRHPEARFETQSDARLGKINDVNRSKFGVGGLIHPYGGVRPAIKLIMDAMNDGAKFFYQSDIKQFFTKIPTVKVVDFVRLETKDVELASIFAKALEVHLKNPEELKGYTHLFPNNGIGVAQGSSLSAFAGNALLFDLDHRLNTMGVTAVRYIDDILIVSKDEKVLDMAVAYAKAELEGLGFGLYDPADGQGKSAKGECASAIHFLGCTIQPKRCVPSKASLENIQRNVQDAFSQSRKSIIEFVEKGKFLDPSHTESSTIETLGKRLYGWQKSFDFCTEEAPFVQLDRYLVEQLINYQGFISRKLRNADDATKSRVAEIPSTAEGFKSAKTTRDKN